MQSETQQHVKLGKCSFNMHKQTISDLLSAVADAAEEQTGDQTQVSENKHVSLKILGYLKTISNLKNCHLHTAFFPKELTSLKH